MFACLSTNRIGSWPAVARYIKASASMAKSVLVQPVKILCFEINLPTIIQDDVLCRYCRLRSRQVRRPLYPCSSQARPGPKTDASHYLYSIVAAEAPCPTITTSANVCSTCIAPACLAYETVHVPSGCGVSTETLNYPCSESRCPGGLCGGTSYVYVHEVTATPTATDGPACHVSRYSTTCRGLSEPGPCSTDWDTIFPAHSMTIIADRLAGQLDIHHAHLKVVVTTTGGC